MVTSGILGLRLVCLTKGIRGNWLFHIWDHTESGGHVASDEMYKCAVDSDAGLAVKDVAKLEASARSRERSEGVHHQPGSWVLVRID